MKTKLFFIVSLFLISFGCKEEKSEIEIIPASEMIYSMKDLDSPPKLKSKDLENTYKEMQDLFVETNKFYKNLDEEKQKKFFLNYNLIYDEKGKLNKVQIIKSDYPELDKEIAKAHQKWEYESALLNDNRVKFYIPWTFDPKLFSTEIPSDLLNKDQTYYVAVENMPEPIGGIYSIQSKIKYPEIAKRAGIEGKVYVLAFIDENGNVVSAKILKGIGAGCDETALNAVKETKFTPGRQNGKPVKTQVSIPIMFKLQ